MAISFEDMATLGKHIHFPLTIKSMVNGQSPAEQEEKRKIISNNTGSADGGPRSRVCAKENNVTHGPQQRNNKEITALLKETPGKHETFRGPLTPKIVVSSTTIAQQMSPQSRDSLAQLYCSCCLCTLILLM